MHKLNLYFWLALLLTWFSLETAEAQVPENINGQNVTEVKHAQGGFRQIGPKLWQETLGSKVGNFQENSRDEWSVYLAKSNGVRVVIDLYKKKVILQDGMKELYIITSASATAVDNSAPQAIGYSNWMQANRAIIGKTPLNKLAIPGAHDAGMYETHDTYMQSTDFTNAALVFAPDADKVKRGLSFLGPIFVRWAKTQDKNFYQQLNDGVRYFDIRVAIDGNERLATCHGVYGASLNTILDDVKRFMDENPNEIVILGFNHFWDLKYQQQQNKGPGEIEGLRTEKWKLLLDTIESTIGVSRLATDQYIATKTLNQLWSGPTRVICNFDMEPPQTRAWTLYKQEEQTWSGDIWRMSDYQSKTLEKNKIGETTSKFWAMRCCVSASADDSFIPLAEFKPVASNYPIGLKEIAADTNPQVLKWILNDWKNAPINLVWADFCDSSLTKACLSRNGIPVDLNGARIGDTKWRNWKTTDQAVAAEFEKLGKELENAANTVGGEVEQAAGRIASFFSGATGYVNPKHVPGNLLYDIRLTTGSQGAVTEEAGTDSNVRIRLHGSKGVSEWFLCDNAGNDFDANTTDSYQLSSKDLGTISKIEIDKDGYGVGPDWFIQKIEIENGSQKLDWKAGRWIKKETVSLALSKVKVEVSEPLTANIALQSDSNSLYLGNFHSPPTGNYYPLMRSTASVGLQLVGEPIYGQGVKMKTTNTSSWWASYKSYNFLTTLATGVSYSKDGQGDNNIWIIESVDGNTGKVQSGQKIRLKSKSHNQYLYPFSSEVDVKTTTKATADASTVWIIRNRK